MNTLRRLLGVVRKELTELVRQPVLLVVLVLGPLLILLLFGAGVRPTDPAVRSIFVTPGDPELAEVVRSYAETQSERLTIEAVTDDEAMARRRLRRGEVDLIVIFPEDPRRVMEQGERATISLRHRFIDPLESQAIELFARGAVDDLNDILLALVIADTQERAEGALDELAALRTAELVGQDQELAQSLDQATMELRQLTEVDPAVLAAPLEGEAETIGGTVTTSQFYGPAVIALILQHLTLTFVALSRARERELGATELLTVSPLREWERGVGQAVAYLVLGVALASVLVAAVSVVLGMPLRNGVVEPLVLVVLEIVGSLTLGLVLARVARTTTAVVQGSMLLLLLSVFFGGLLLSPERLLPWARPIGWPLPMSHALPGLRDSMLRGATPGAAALTGLVAIPVVLLAVAWLLARRDAKTAG